MSQRAVVVLLALCVALYLAGVGLTATRGESKRDPESAPGWIDGGLSSVLSPLGKALSPKGLSLDAGRSPGWEYDPGTGRLRFARQTQLPATAHLRIAAESSSGFFDRPRSGELALVESVGQPPDTKFWPVREGVAEPEDFTQKPRRGEALRMTFPPAGGFLVVSLPPRSTCTLEVR